MIETPKARPGWPNLRLLLILLWGGAILVLSLDPSPPVPEGRLLGWDKFQHAAAFGLLTLLWGRFLIAFRGCREGCWLRSFWCAVGYGAFIELAQALLTSSRSAEWGDLLADAVGAGGVAVVAALSSAIESRRAPGKSERDDKR